MRRVSAVDGMLLATVLLWALNVTVTRYIVTHGFHPLAYGATRYLAAIVLFWAFTWRRERSFRIARADFPLVGLASLLIFVNQLAFVYGLRETSASVVGLMLGTVPIYAGMIATAVGLERLTGLFWAAAAVSFAGVGLIAAGDESAFAGHVWAYGIAISIPVTWAAYSVSIAPLMRSYSPFRISSVVLPIGWVPLALISIPQLSSQGTGGWGWTMALAFGFAVVGPLFLTNILWFTAIGRVGPSRAALFANLQPFFAVLFAVVLLSEHLSGWEVAGGVAIALGIAIERRGHTAASVVLAAE